MSALTKITIVTITYNSEKTIEQTLESVVSQKYDNLEYWIIDGASKDGTMEIVTEYAKRYDFIRYLSEPDKGISDAFNKGIKLATGKFIGFINSDDQLFENALMSVHRTYLDTGADVIYGDTIINDVENGLTLYKKSGEPDYLKFAMPFIHQSCYIKKRVYDECGYYLDEYKICMDYDMLARIYHKGYKFARVDAVLSVFQYGGTSCEHPIRTINEDIRIAASYGLSNREIRKYKMKCVSINMAKLVLSRLKLWAPLYRLLKRKDIMEI